MSRISCLPSWFRNVKNSPGIPFGPGDLFFLILLIAWSSSSSVNACVGVFDFGSLLRVSRHLLCLCFVALC